MAVVANIVSQKWICEYDAKLRPDRKSKFLANILNDTAEYIFNQERNIAIDNLFTAIKSTREPGVIKYIGYKNNATGKGLDVVHVKLEEFYPERVNTFFMKDIHRCIWRKVWDYQDWKDNRVDASSFFDTDLVKNAGAVRSDSQTFFDISNDLREGQVEELLWFDEIADEFIIEANDIIVFKATLKSLRYNLNIIAGFDKAPHDNKEKEV
jgi:hypothetical protein